MTFCVTFVLLWDFVGCIFHTGSRCSNPDYFRTHCVSLAGPKHTDPFASLCLLDAGKMCATIPCCGMFYLNDIPSGVLPKRTLEGGARKAMEVICNHVDSPGKVVPHGVTPLTYPVGKALYLKSQALISS